MNQVIDKNVVVTRIKDGKILWRENATGQALIEYVPAQAFRDADAGLVSIEFVEGRLPEHEGWAKNCRLPDEERPGGDGRDVYAHCKRCALKN